MAIEAKQLIIQVEPDTLTCAPKMDQLIIHVEALVSTDPDFLAPASPVLGTTYGSQGTGGGAVPKGRSTMQMNWTIPPRSEWLPGEYLGLATGGVDAFSTALTPVTSSPAEQVYEHTSDGAASESITAAASKREFRLTVVTPGSFSVGDWVCIEDGSGNPQEYNKIAAVEVTKVKLENPLQIDVPATGWSLQEVNVTLKTETTDYTINRTTGAVTTVSGQFTNGSKVFVRYSITESKIDHFELYRIPGNFPVEDSAHRDDVLAHGSVETASTAIVKTAVQYDDTMTDTANGLTITYYLFCVDEAGNPSRAQCIMIESLTTILQGFSKSVGDHKVLLSWNPVTDVNFTGLNIYRCSNTWDPANAVKVNSTPVTGTTFEDGAGNTTNRRPVGEVPYPSGTVVYAAETNDATTDWDTGTQNQSNDPLKSEVTTASKVDD